MFARRKTTNFRQVTNFTVNVGMLNAGCPVLMSCSYFSVLCSYKYDCLNGEERENRENLTSFKNESFKH